MSIDIDDLIKKHVNGHEADIDPNEIWAGVQAKQKNKPRRKLIGLIYLSLLLIVPLCWLSIRLVTQNQTTADTTKLVENSEASFNTTDTVYNSDNTTFNPIDLNANNQEISNSPVESNTSDNTQGNTIVTPQLTENQFNSEKNKSFSKSLVSTSQSNLLNDKQLQSPDHRLRPQSSLQENEMTAVLPSTSNSVSESSNNGNSASALPVSKEKLVPFHTIDLITSDVLAYESDSYDPQLITINTLQRQKWLLSAVTGYSKIVNRSITSLSSSPYDTYRNNSETALDALSGNLLLSYNLSDAFTLSSGISFQRDYELFEWQGSYIVDSQGALVSQGVDDELPSSFRNSYLSEERDSRIYNQYEYYGIPIFLKYNFGQSRIRTALLAGITATVHKSFDGLVLNEDRLPVELAMIQDEVKIGLKYSCSLALEYPIYNSWALQSSIGYSYRKNEQRDLRLQYHYVDFRLGIQHRF